MKRLTGSTLSQKSSHLSVTLSNLTDFQNLSTAGKRMKFAAKSTQQYPPTLGMLLHYFGIFKIQIFCKYSADMGKMQTNYIFSAQILIILLA